MRIYRNVAAMKLMKFAISFHIQYKKAKFQWDEAIISSTLKYHFIGKCAIEVTNDHQLNSCELNEMSRSGSLFFLYFFRVEALNCGIMIAASIFPQNTRRISTEYSVE